LTIIKKYFIILLEKIKEIKNKMKQKELKNLAKRIAEQEKIFRNPDIT
jgi:CHASE3 domain sensor protein